MRNEWLNCRDRRPRLSDTDATLYGKYRFVIRTVEDACPYNNVSIYLFVPASIFVLVVFRQIDPSVIGAEDIFVVGSICTDATSPKTASRCQWRHWFNANS